jgi:UDP-N-acetylmuramoyl-tripeptide--D-alanyl-D-alanine ligase
MQVAVENFANMEEPNKILMLGGMMELGETSIQEHAALIELIKKYNWKQVLLVGGDYAQIEHPYLNFKNAAEAKAWFNRQHFKQVAVLIKGSRSMQMEKILE